MDDLSWRARLARRNINILGVDQSRWYYEFMYHPYPGQTKWCKTFHPIPEAIATDPEAETETGTETETETETIARDIEAEVLALRKELEG